MVSPFCNRFAFRGLGRACAEFKLLDGALLCSRPSRVASPSEGNRNDIVPDKKAAALVIWRRYLNDSGVCSPDPCPVPEIKVPPFRIYPAKTRERHRRAQQLAMNDLLGGESTLSQMLRFKAGMGKCVHLIEPGAHIRNTPFTINQAYIDRHPE